MSLEGYPFFWSLNFITNPSILTLHLFLVRLPHPQGVISHHKPIVPSRIEHLVRSSLTLNEKRDPNTTSKHI
jgi:hypothetical protein